MIVNARISHSQVLGPKQGIHTIPSNASGHCRKNKKAEKIGKWGDGEKICEMLSSGHDAAHAVMVYSSSDWWQWACTRVGCQWAIIDCDGPTWPFMLNYDGFWERGTYCLQLCSNG